MDPTLVLERDSEVDVEVVVATLVALQVRLDDTVSEVTVLIQQAEPRAFPELEVRAHGPGAQTTPVVGPGVEVAATNR